MGDKSHGVMQKIHEHTPNSAQFLGFITLFVFGSVFLLLMGPTLIGTILGLVLLTLFLIFFSPILIPVATVLFVAVAGFFSAGGFGLAALSAISWLYNYIKGRRPPGADRIDYARMRIADTANHVKDYAREYSGYLQSKIQDAAPGA